MQRSSILNGGDLHRLVVDNITELVALLDPDGVVLYASAAHEHKLGYAPEELIGGVLTTLIHPDDLGQVGDAFEVCATDGRAQLPEFRIRHRDGRWLVLDGGLTAIDAGGLELTLVTARDVTERARRDRAEREFVANDGGRIAAEALADHVVVTPSEHIPRIQEAQASAYHLLRELVG
ncbi:MAG: PAS domain S-box protein [Actinobacteria bacterium]|nr:PAS domain S-box protein [Actinomycetota bacterium]